MTQIKSFTKLVPIAVSTLVAIVGSIHPAIATESEDTKARLLADIAFQYAELGESERSKETLEQAIPLVQAMHDLCFQANPLAKIAGSYFLLEQNDQANQFLAMAVQTAQAQASTGCSSSGTSPTESLLNRTREYAANGHFDLAVDLGLKLGDPVTLAELSSHLEKAGQSQRAEGNLTQAIAIAQGIPDQQIRLQIFVVMAERFRLAEQPLQALRVLEQAVESSGTQPTSASEIAIQIGPVLQIARSFAAIEANSQALKVLDQVMPKIQALPVKSFPFDRINYQVDAALQYAGLGQESRSTDLLADALTTAQTLPNDSNRSREDALRQVAVGYAELGNFESALTIARSIQSAGERDSALQAIAIAYARTGNVDAAVKLAKSSGNQNGTLIGIVRHYLTQKQPEQAWSLVQEQQVKGIFSEVALGYLEVGQPDQALKVVQVGELKDFVPAISLSYARSGQSEQVLEMLKTQSAEWVVPEIAREFADQRQLDLALQVTRSINDKTYRTQALMAIAQSYTQSSADESEEAQGLLSYWLNFIQGIFGDSEQEKAIEVLDEAIEITRSL